MTVKECIKQFCDYFGACKKEAVLEAVVAEIGEYSDSAIELIYREVLRSRPDTWGFPDVKAVTDAIIAANAKKTLITREGAAASHIKCVVCGKMYPRLGTCAECGFYPGQDINEYKKDYEERKAGALSVDIDGIIKNLSEKIRVLKTPEKKGA
ncbi:hypothetical protein K7I13_12080 [Brucepastera parasyntrophica]|uniref:hypothetical protein n=1 Tax=Brucepastera parasyntrophica TaxID=2880008 RepID=UPI00210D4E6B|nr:hypothetical protein [Brucepastera parasyntrophica]ULQ59225.1 hypothetical protein K7I13_12080 [Brucepastera parasyntrophica]